MAAMGKSWSCGWFKMAILQTFICEVEAAMTCDVPASNTALANPRLIQTLSVFLI